MITIHHLGGSQSERIVWLCEEIGLPYELVRHERERGDAAGAAPAEYKAMHPAGTAPIIIDGALVLSETGAIMEYLIRRYSDGGLILSPDHPDFAEYLFWFHYANGTVIPAIMLESVSRRLGVEPISSRLDRAFALIEQRLETARWFAGDTFTAADIMMVYPLIRSRAGLGRDISHMPNLLAYLARLSERPAFQTAMARAEPDSPPALT